MVYSSLIWMLWSPHFSETVGDVGGRVNKNRWQKWIMHCWLLKLSFLSALHKPKFSRCIWLVAHSVIFVVCSWFARDPPNLCRLPLQNSAISTVLFFSMQLQQCNHVNSDCYCKKWLVRCWFIEICLLPLFSPFINSSATEETVMSVEVVWLPPLERSGQSNVDTRNDWIIQPLLQDSLPVNLSSWWDGIPSDKVMIPPLFKNISEVLVRC